MALLSVGYIWQYSLLILSLYLDWFFYFSFPLQMSYDNSHCKINIIKMWILQTCIYLHISLIFAAWIYSILSYSTFQSDSNIWSFKESCKHKVNAFLLLVNFICTQFQKGLNIKLETWKWFMKFWWKIKWFFSNFVFDYTKKHVRINALPYSAEVCVWWRLICKHKYVYTKKINTNGISFLKRYRIHKILLLDWK